MPTVLIASDKFKGPLTAAQVADAVAEGGAPGAAGCADLAVVEMADVSGLTRLPLLVRLGEQIATDHLSCRTKVSRADSGEGGRSVGRPIQDRVRR